jgi:hypothetical protein
VVFFSLLPICGACLLDSRAMEAWRARVRAARGLIFEDEEDDEIVHVVQNIIRVEAGKKIILQNGKGRVKGHGKIGD